MKQLLLATALLLPATLAGAVTRADLTDEAKAEIRTMLTGNGYEVRQIQTEDGLFEAYALKDGKRYEVYLDADMQIVRIKLDD